MIAKSAPVIPTSNEIRLFFHCNNCMPMRPPDTSMREWARIECGWTPIGFQAWCMRCEMNICHVDFEGVQHPANLSRPLQ